MIVALNDVQNVLMIVLLNVAVLAATAGAFANLRPLAPLAAVRGSNYIRVSLLSSSGRAIISSYPPVPTARHARQFHTN